MDETATTQIPWQYHRLPEHYHYDYYWYYFMSTANTLDYINDSRENGQLSTAIVVAEATGAHRKSTFLRQT